MSEITQDHLNRAYQDGYQNGVIAALEHANQLLMKVEQEVIEKFKEQKDER